VARVALFVLLLCVVGAGAAGVGALVGDGGAAAAPADGMAMAAGAPEGLAATAGDYTLAPAGTSFAQGEHAFRFRILDANGRPTHAFDEEGGVLLHLIVVRRDLGADAYQHVHPTLQPDGSWRAPLRFDTAGAYRAFADFEVDGAKTVLGTDLFVPGWSRAPQPLRIAATSAAGPYRVRLAHGALRAGEESSLRFTVDGADGFQTYLGARGHLVALHTGDLAYTHVHPTGGGGGGDIVFDADFRHAGTYRLFLQFKREGRIYTAPFAVEVAR
jgi:hypothetical protein